MNCTGVNEADVVLRTRSIAAKEEAVQRLSVCRSCMNCCPIVVDVENGRALTVTGDRENELYRGFTCVKGRALPALLSHPERLQHSMMRTASGELTPISSQRVTTEVAERLTEIVDQHGPRAVALYTGTFGGYSHPAGMRSARALMRALGSSMVFDPATIDQPGKAIALAMHGNWTGSWQAFSDPDVALLIGANPLVSFQGMPIGNVGKWLSEALERGMKLIVIDPRRSDVAKRASLHLQPMPGNDAAILAAMIRVILEEGLYDDEFVTENVSGLDPLRKVVSAFDPDLVARQAGISSDDVVAAARMFATAGRGYAAAGTGPSMSGYSTLVEYLVLNLDTLCGHTLRAGELVKNPGTLWPALSPKAQAIPPWPAYDTGEAMRVHGGMRGSIAGPPVAMLADEILLEGDGQVRALISFGGNPVAMWPDQLKTIAALEKLDLLVQIDPWMSATARYADYIVAPKMCLEVPGLTNVPEALTRIIGYSLGYADSYAQYSPAIVEPPSGSDLLTEWQFFLGLAQHMDLTVNLAMDGSERGLCPPGALADATDDDMLGIVTAGSRIPLDEVKQHPHGALFPEPAVRVADKEPGWEGRLDVANVDMMTDLDQIAAGLDAGDSDANDEFPYRLLPRRVMRMFNSTVNNSATNRGRGYNPAFIHPADLSRLELASGDVARIASAQSSILAVLEADESLREGCISMAHGFGGSPEQDHRVRSIGSPTSRLCGADRGFERYSGQPQMSGIPVTIERVEELSGS